MVMLQLPQGTYSTKPAPAVGFKNISVTTRPLVPALVVHGKPVNSTVDVITWVADQGYELPTWAVQEFCTSSFNIKEDF